MIPSMRTRLALLLLLLLPALTSALEFGDSRSDFRRYPEAAGCIGGDQCGHSKKIRVKLDDRPVVGVRFTADDMVGDSTKGSLTITIDDTILEYDLDIPKEGKEFRLDVESLRGKTLTFEPESDDEVRIRDVAVVYAGRTPPPTDRGWQDYSKFAACIGGTECRQRRIKVPLERRPIEAIRFHAQDDIGDTADGELTVRIDDREIESFIDVKKGGKIHELTVANLTGRELVFEPSSDDEVEIDRIELRYARRGDRDWDRGGDDDGLVPPLTERGGCIGGRKCGGMDRKIRVRLEDRPIRSIRFRAHDDLGPTRDGMLRVRVDDRTLETDLDVSRTGRDFEIDGEGRRGRWLVVEVIEDDEVVVEGLEVRYGR